MLCAVIATKAYFGMGFPIDRRNKTTVAMLFDPDTSIRLMFCVADDKKKKLLSLGALPN